MAAAMWMNRPTMGKVFILFLSLLFAAASVDASAKPLVLKLDPLTVSTSGGKIDSVLAYEAEWAVCEAPAGGDNPPEPAPPSVPPIIPSLHAAKTELPPENRAPPRAAPCPTPPATGPPSA